MTILIIKKQVEESWLSLKKIRSFKHKGIRYFLYKKYYEARGYKVKVLEQ